MNTKAKTLTNVQIQDQHSDLLISIPQAGIQIYPRYLLYYKSIISTKQTIHTMSTLTNAVDLKLPAQKHDQLKSNINSNLQEKKVPINISLKDCSLVFQFIEEENTIKLSNITTGKQVLQFKVNNQITLKTVQSIFRNKLCEVGFQKKYTVEQHLGKGGTSEVYVAKRKADNKKFAVKIVSLKSSNEKNYKIFINEIQILRKLNHPNIIKLQSIYYFKKKFYAVLEYLNGGTLLQELRSNFPETKEHRYSIIFDIIKGLQHLRQKTIVHRDLKLENILIRENNDGTKDYVLSDFGLASYVNEKQPLFDKCGTPGYIAPQVLLSKKNTVVVSHKSDVFSFGVIVHYIVFGKPVFRVENNDAKQLLEQNRKFKIDLNKTMYSSLSQNLKKLFYVSLSIDLSNRYSSDQILQFMLPSLYLSYEQFRTACKLKTFKINSIQNEKNNKLRGNSEKSKLDKYYSNKKLDKQTQPQRSNKFNFGSSSAKRQQVLKPQSFSKNKLESKEIKSSFVKQSLVKSLEKLKIRGEYSCKKDQETKHKKSASLVDQDRKKDNSFIGNIWDKITGKKSSSSRNINGSYLKTQ